MCIHESVNINMKTFLFLFYNWPCDDTVMKKCEMGFDFCSAEGLLTPETLCVLFFPFVQSTLTDKTSFVHNFFPDWPKLLDPIDHQTNHWNLKNCIAHTKISLVPQRRDRISLNFLFLCSLIFLPLFFSLIKLDVVCKQPMFTFFFPFALPAAKNHTWHVLDSLSNPLAEPPRYLSKLKNKKKNKKKIKETI